MSSISNDKQLLTEKEKDCLKMIIEFNGYKNSKYLKKTTILYKDYLNIMIKLYKSLDEDENKDEYGRTRSEYGAATYEISESNENRYFNNLEEGRKYSLEELGITMTETFKMDRITIELDEEGYLVGSSSPNLIDRLQVEFYKLRLEDDATDLYYQTQDLKEYFRFYDAGSGIKVDVFDANKLSNAEKGIFLFTMYPIDTLLEGLENED